MNNYNAFTYPPFSTLSQSAFPSLPYAIAPADYSAFLKVVGKASNEQYHGPLNQQRSVLSTSSAFTRVHIF